MKETYWGYWLIILGILILGVMLLVNSTSTSSTQDYYTIKEVTQASMIDAIDFAYYRLWGDVKMSEQKFVENFLRRFADNTTLSNTYEVSFYDLYEVPPKVSVKIASKTGTYNVAFDPTSFDVVSTIDAILEVGVPTNNNTTKKKLACPLFINASFSSDLKYAMKNNDYSKFGSGASKAKQIASKWQELGTDSGDNLKKAFNELYKDVENLNGNALYTTHPELKVWKNKGYITI